MTTPQPDTLKTILDELGRRLRALETAPRLIHSSIKNGTLRLLDGNNVTRFFIGAVNEVESGAGSQGDPPPNLYGITMRDSLGGYCLEIAGGGFGLPEIPFPMYPQLGMVAGWHYIDITSGSFQAVYQASLPIVQHDAVRIGVDVSCDAGTTAEVRISNFVAGGVSSDAYVMPAATRTQREFLWLHQQPLHTGPFQPRIEVRRASGAGVVHVFPPTVTTLCSERWTPATVAG